MPKAQGTMERPEFDLRNTQALIERYDGLKTFAAVAEWDKAAQAEVETISRAVDSVYAYERQAQADLSAAQQERQSKNAVARMFHSKSSETALQKDIEWARQRRADLEEIADQLLELIDFTPNDETDRKGLLKELRLEKKELQIQKREVAAEMKAVRTEARQASARIEPIPLRGFSKYSAIDRRRIRREKESLLKPAENAKAALDRQLVAIDRRINWLERFGE